MSVGVAMQKINNQNGLSDASILFKLEYTSINLFRCNQQFRFVAQDLRQHGASVLWSLVYHNVKASASRDLHFRPIKNLQAHITHDNELNDLVRDLELPTN